MLVSKIQYNPSFKFHSTQHELFDAPILEGKIYSLFVIYINRIIANKFMNLGWRSWSSEKENEKSLVYNILECYSP